MVSLASKSVLMTQPHPTLCERVNVLKKTIRNGNGCTLSSQSTTCCGGGRNGSSKLCGFGMGDGDVFLSRYDSTFWITMGGGNTGDNSHIVFVTFFTFSDINVEYPFESLRLTHASCLVGLVGLIIFF